MVGTVVRKYDGICLTHGCGADASWRRESTGKWRAPAAQISERAHHHRAADGSLEAQKPQASNVIRLEIERVGRERVLCVRYNRSNARQRKRMRAKGRGYGEVRVVTGFSCLSVCACVPCGNRNMADKKETGTVKWFNVKKGCTCPPPLALVSPNGHIFLAGLRAFYQASVRPPDSVRSPTHANTHAAAHATPSPAHSHSYS